MKIAQILDRRRNNLDLFRLIAACMVIYGHSYALAPPPHADQDFVARILPFDYAGSLAVKFFFFLSGLLVSNSLLQNRDVVGFCVSRTMRIIPAFIVVLIFAAFAVGPIFTTSTLESYFSSSAPYSYVWESAMMNIQYKLPGVFEDNTYKSAVNGSLWTIPKEVFGYLALGAVFLLGVFRSKMIATLVCIVILIDPLVGNKLLFTWVSDKETILLAPCFAFGVLLAVWREQLEVNASVAAGLFLLCVLFWNSSFNFYFVYAFVFVSVVWLSSWPLLLRMRPPIDISYGTYLYGFIVQQVLSSLFPNRGMGFHQIVPIVLSCFLGIGSWYLVERRALAFGHRFVRRRGDGQPVANIGIGPLERS